MVDIVPDSEQKLYSIPEKYHGIYHAGAPESERIQICDKGIFRIVLTVHEQPLDFYRYSQECMYELGDFYRPDSVLCVHIDFASYPDIINTKLFRIDTVFAINQDYVLTEYGDKLFLNYLHNDYSSLKIVERSESGQVFIYIVEIDDVLNEHGLVFKSISQVRKSNGKYQFVTVPTEEELQKMLDYGYHKAEYILIPF